MALREVEPNNLSRVQITPHNNYEGEKSTRHELYENQSFPQLDKNSGKKWVPKLKKCLPNLQEKLVAGSDSRQSFSSQSNNTNAPDDSESSSECLKGNEPFEWTPYAELHLLNALRGLRPVGKCYHFCMSIVYERFTKAMGVQIPIEDLKNKLNEFYNFDEALKICGEDTLPLNEVPFNLPPSDFPEIKVLLSTTDDCDSSDSEEESFLKTAAKGRNSRNS